jgi:hypothetical protein
MLTVISGMNPHMICGNWDLVLLSLGLGFVEVGFSRLWVGHDETLMRSRLLSLSR